MCFLRFNKYKVKHMSSVKWVHLENFEPNSINSIFHNYYNLNCELVP